MFQIVPWDCYPDYGGFQQAHGKKKEGGGPL